MLLKHARSFGAFFADLERWADAMRQVREAPRGLEAQAVELRYMHGINGQVPPHEVAAKRGRTPPRDAPGPSRSTVLTSAAELPRRPPAAEVVQRLHSSRHVGEVMRAGAVITRSVWVLLTFNLGCDSPGLGSYLEQCSAMSGRTHCKTGSHVFESETPGVAAGIIGVLLDPRVAGDLLLVELHVDAYTGQTVPEGAVTLTLMSDPSVSDMAMLEGPHHHEGSLMLAVGPEACPASGECLLEFLVEGAGTSSAPLPVPLGVDVTALAVVLGTWTRTEYMKPTLSFSAGTSP
jgi:hypothetical protein